MISQKRRPGTVSFARFKLGISQQQMADALGVSRSMVAMFETGKRKLPRDVNAIYVELCDRAAAINPSEAIVVRRGRKPNLSQRAVTNCKQTVPANNEALALHWLSLKKVELEGQRVVAQFRLKAIEERARQISEQLDFAEAMQKVHTAVLEVLPEGKEKDKHELRLMAMQFKQLKWRQALKYSPVDMLKAQFQLAMAEAAMVALEEFTELLEKNADPVLMISRVLGVAA